MGVDGTYDVGAGVKGLALAVVLTRVRRRVLHLERGVGARRDGGREAVELIALVAGIQFDDVAHYLGLEVGLRLGV